MKHVGGGGKRGGGDEEKVSLLTVRLSVAFKVYMIEKQRLLTIHSVNLLSRRMKTTRAHYHFTQSCNPSQALSQTFIMLPD